MSLETELKRTKPVHAHNPMACQNVKFEDRFVFLVCHVATGVILSDTNQVLAVAVMLLVATCYWCFWNSSSFFRSSSKIDYNLLEETKRKQKNGKLPLND